MPIPASSFFSGRLNGGISAALAFSLTVCLLAGCAQEEAESTPNQDQLEQSEDSREASADAVEDIKDDIENAQAKGDPPEKPETLLTLAEDMYKTVEAEAGGVEKDHVLTLRIIYANPAQAHQGAQGFQKEGFEVEVMPPEPDSTRTPILARIQLKPDLQTLKSTMAIVNAQLEALEGEYDSYVLNQGTMADAKKKE